MSSCCLTILNVAEHILNLLACGVVHASSSSEPVTIHLLAVAAKVTVWAVPVMDYAMPAAQDTCLHEGFSTHLHLAHMWHIACSPSIPSSNDSHEPFALETLFRDGHSPLVSQLVSQQEVVDVLHCMQCGGGDNSSQ